MATRDEYLDIDDYIDKLPAEFEETASRRERQIPAPRQQRERPVPALRQPNLKSPPNLIKLKEVGILNNYRAIAPIDHRVEVDALTYLDAMTPDATDVIGKKIKWQGSVLAHNS